MNAEMIINDAAATFSNTAQAILKRCKQSGMTFSLDGQHVTFTGSNELIEVWGPILVRHQKQIYAELSGKPCTPADDDRETITADQAELLRCIRELCELAGYSDQLRYRMIAAVQHLTPAQYTAEAAYFLRQLCRFKAGEYCGVQPPKISGNTNTSPNNQERNQGQAGRRTA